MTDASASRTSVESRRMGLRPPRAGGWAWGGGWTWHARVLGAAARRSGQAGALLGWAGRGAEALTSPIQDPCGSRNGSSATAAARCLAAASGQSVLLRNGTSDASASVLAWLCSEPAPARRPATAPPPAAPTAPPRTRCIALEPPRIRPAVLGLLSSALELRSIASLLVSTTPQPRAVATRLPERTRRSSSSSTHDPPASSLLPQTLRLHSKVRSMLRNCRQRRGCLQPLTPGRAILRGFEGALT